ncbi:glycoside hydrolase family protein [Puniceicoccaceae bacterium K14]|nr:glycoside hydrolase family protein [Puniceicoccaceae bacterium K14]
MSNYRVLKRILGLLACLVFVLSHTALGQDTATSTIWKNDLFENIEPSPVGGGHVDENYWVWGSSVMQGDDGKFHMFVSRWPKEMPFHPGWMVKSEIAHCVSDTAEGPYTFVDVALGARGAKFWDGQSCHNPRVVKYKDTYVMFYMGSTHPLAEIDDPADLTLDSAWTVIGRSNKRIGIATAKDLNGPWERRDTCVLDTKPDTFYEFLTSNPAPWINEDGSVTLIFKARKYNDEFPYHSSMMIGLATASHFEGPYEVVGDEPIFGPDKMGEIEDPYLWKDESGYHMIAKDMKSSLGGEHHAGILAHSKDAVNWELDENPLAYSREITWDDGQTIKMGQLERPFGLIQEGKMTHLFFATMDGPGGFGNSTKSWNMVVPLIKK